MRRKSMILAVVSLTGLLAASPAWAGCKLRDLAGTYQIYSHWIDDGGFADWTRCTLVVRNNGTVKPTGGICQDSDDVPYDVTGGSFSVTGACVVTGSVVTATEGTFVIDHSRFDLSRNVITGVGHDMPDGGNFSFTAMRK